MSQLPSLVSVHITTADLESARALARALVQEGLAACANLLPGATSIYRWKDRLCEDPECLVLLKARADQLPALVQRARELHAYELPCVVALPVVGGSEPYLQWVADTGREADANEVTQ